MADPGKSEAVPLRGSITTPVLFVASCAVVALLIAETVFGVLWQLGGDFRSYVSIVQ